MGRTHLPFLRQASSVSIHPTELHVMVQGPNTAGHHRFNPFKKDEELAAHPVFGCVLQKLCISAKPVTLDAAYYRANCKRVYVKTQPRKRPAATHKTMPRTEARYQAHTQRSHRLIPHSIASFEATHCLVTPGGCGECEGWGSKILVSRFEVNLNSTKMCSARMLCTQAHGRRHRENTLSTASQKLSSTLPQTKTNRKFQ